ncbi:MAG: hypothetical protein WKF95_00645 [Rubrobacter sp.]
MAGNENHGGVLSGGISRTHFLKLVGLGAGLSLFPGSLFPSGTGLAQTVGGPTILSGARYPIAAWWPPPPVPKDPNDPNADNVKTNALYAELAGAGFNTVLGGNGVANDRANRLALEACASNELRLVLADQALRNAIDGTAVAPAAQTEGQEEPQSALQALTEQDSSQDLQAQAAADPEAVSQRIRELYTLFGNEPALAGLLLYDEPHRSLFGILRHAKEQVEQQIGQQPGEDLPYVNVWPSHASPQNALGAESYTNYLEKYMNETRYPSAVAPPMLSFDHYPLLTDERTTADFFYNHAVIRNFSRRFRVPSWGFVQSVGFDGRDIGLAPRRSPDEAEIFWQINVALAYGVKGIQYFTYWTPASGNGIRFGNALITRAGQRTALYGYSQRANDYLAAVGGQLLPLVSEAVVHFGEQRLPRGTVAFRPDAFVRAMAGSPAILSRFRNPTTNERYLLVTNRSPNVGAQTRLTISDLVQGVEEFDPVTGEYTAVPIRATQPRYLYVRVPPGRARLYRLRTA